MSILIGTEYMPYSEWLMKHAEEQFSCPSFRKNWLIVHRPDIALWVHENDILYDIVIKFGNALSLNPKIFLKAEIYIDYKLVDCQLFHKMTFD